MKNFSALFVGIAALAIASDACAELGVATRTGAEAEAFIAYYRYREPGVMTSTGPKLGVDMRGNKVLQNGSIFRGDLRFAFGTVDYSSNGTGSSSGETDLYIETRGLVGRDWSFNDRVLSPYIGLGYRYLFNDARGYSCTSTSCYWGYRRESNYFYWPVGMIFRTRLDDRAVLESTLEYDHLQSGKQISRLSDGGTGYSDITNTQGKGFGMKVSVMYQRKDWVMGAYAHYWKIAKSNWVPLYQNGLPVLDASGRPLGGVEPDNNTIEFGIKLSERF